MPSPDFVTLLWPEDGSPTAKRLTPQGVQPAQQHTWFSAEQVPIQNADTLAKVLTFCTTESQSIFLVRGQIISATPQHMRRTHASAEPTLAACAHSWLLLDLDKYLPDLAPEVFAADPAKYAAEARAALPEPFQQAQAWWQATGSAGDKPGARLRLAFWLDRPMADAELKAWTETWQVPVDQSLFTPSQPHYLARPILEGVPDPVPGPRCGVLPGEPHVAVPDLTMPRTTQAMDDLAKAVRRLRKAPEGERNNRLNAEIFQLITRHGPEVKEPAIIEACQAISSLWPSWGAKELGTIASAVRGGLARHAQAREGWRAAMALSDDGNPRATAANTSLILTHHEAWQGTLAYSERDVARVWVKPPPWGGQVPRAVKDTDIPRIVEWFQAGMHMDARQGWVEAGVALAAEAHRYDAIQDWLQSLAPWDGRTRLDTFFIRHWQVQDTPLVRAQSRCWFIQAARRAFATLENPVQADYVIVLCGEQGLRKSSALATLCPRPKYFSDNLPPLSNKDSCLTAARSWIIELSEFRQSRHDRDLLKAFITTQADRFRPPYGHNEIVVPRRCVFIGTVNDQDFLSDPSGNRRFWPMAVHKRADLGAVQAERAQIWAEAYAVAQTDELAYLASGLEVQAKAAEAEHAEELIALPKLEAVLRKPPGPLGVQAEAWQLDQGRLVRVTTSQACEIVNANVHHRGQAAQVQAMLRALGWSAVRARVQGALRRYWTPPADWAWDVAEARAN